jgi:hypothetical protein
MEKHNPGLDPRQASFMVRGLDIAENIRASGAGRKMFLDIPFYRTGDYTSVRFFFAFFCVNE